MTGTLDAKAWVFVQGNDKFYDGTDAAAETLSFKATSTGDVPTAGGNAVTLDPGPGSTATFNTKNVGTSKPITYSGFILGGGNSDRFSLFGDGSGTTAGTIKAKALTLTPVTGTKTYDGGIASAAVVTVAGNVSGDTVTAAEEYASKNVLGAGGSILGIKAGYTILDGASANMSGNYTITDTATAAGTITPAALAINAVTDSRVYNGTTSSAGVVTNSCLQAGDTLTGLTQAYASKNVLGANLSILNVNGGYTLTDGNSGGNYTVTTNTAVGTITKAVLTITADDKGKTYGASDPTLTASYSAFQYSDTAAGAVTGLSLSTATGATATAGTHIIDASGSTAANYTITEVDGTLTVAASNASKTYGQTPTLTALTTAANAVAGSTYAITPSNATGGTFSSANYTMTPLVQPVPDVAPPVTPPDVVPPVTPPGVVPPVTPPAVVRDQTPIVVPKIYVPPQRPRKNDRN